MWSPVPYVRLDSSMMEGSEVPVGTCKPTPMYPPQFPSCAQEAGSVTFGWGPFCSPPGRSCISVWAMVDEQIHQNRVESEELSTRSLGRVKLIGGMRKGSLHNGVQ